jgi:NAD-dependent deacetylase
MKHIVVLTGAGISAESGLQTFRDGDGLWNGHRVEDVASPEGWRKDRAMVLDFYNMRRREARKAQPNRAHFILAELEQHFRVTIITQNIDNLHEQSGSGKVLHLHGEIFKMRSSLNPDLIYDTEEDILPGDKAEDGAQLRPHIVWFGEQVPMIEVAADITATADIFVVIGTSLVVYPAASLINLVPDEAPIYIVDKKIPLLSGAVNIQAIEKPATQGMEDLKAMLLADIQAGM